MRQTVIGVFGPSGPNVHGPAARAVGRLVGVTDVVLTGGTGHVDGSVEEQAVVGARAAAGRWLVIPKAGRSVDMPRDGTAHALVTPYGNRRNYLNALVAQAAVAFRGGPGTDSEVAFALALGRPVVLLGPGWDDVALDGPALIAMIDALFEPAAGPMGSAIAAARQVCRALTGPDVTRTADVGAAVATALDRAVPADLAPLDVLIDRPTRSALTSWLQRR